MTASSVRPNRAGTHTRDRIRRAAVELFAAEGIESVTLGRINRAAGQRNNSAAQYHFGGKDELVADILRHYARQVTTARAAAVDDLTRRTAPELVDVMHALVDPLAALAVDDDDGGAAYVILLASVLAGPGHDLVPADPPNDPAWRDWLSLLRAAGGRLPADVRRIRGELVSTLVVHGLADWSRRRRAGGDVPAIERYASCLAVSAAGCYAGVEGR